MRLSKILVAHDLSEPATHALLFAHDVACAMGAKLEVVYVHPDLYAAGADPTLTLPHALPGQAERYLQFLQEELQRIVKQAIGEAGRDVRCHVVRGNPAQRIVELAQEVAASMICVSATGKGAVQRVMLGSVSQHVLRTASLPVLLVPGPVASRE